MTPPGPPWHARPAWAQTDGTALPPPPGPGEVQLWLMSLDEPAWPSADLHALLDTQERERASRFHFELHRLRFAHGRGLLRRMLAHCTGVAPDALRFEYGAQGKPRLVGQRNGSVPLAFNLSHSGPYALLGLSDGAEIGADIEVPRAVPELNDIAAQNFAPGEQRTLRALPVERHADAFLACWTRKEAFVKALGGGLSVPLDGFEVSLDPDAPAQLLRSADPAHPVADFTLWAGRTPNDCWAACAVRRPQATVRTLTLR